MNISLYAEKRNHILIERITKHNLWRPGLRHPGKNRWARIRVPGTEIDVLVVELTRGYTMITDAIPEVGELLRERCYYATIDGTEARPYSQDGYFYRHLMERLHGDLHEDQEVDHIDRCPLNNTMANLRLVSSSGNNRNIGRRKDNTSGHKRDQVWQVRCGVNGKTRYRSINPSKLGVSKEAALELAIQARKASSRMRWAIITSEDVGYLHQVRPGCEFRIISG